MITMLDMVISVIVLLLITQCYNDGWSLSISLLSIATMTTALKYTCLGELISVSIGEVNFKTAFHDPPC